MLRNAYDVVIEETTVPGEDGEIPAAKSLLEPMVRGNSCIESKKSLLEPKVRGDTCIESKSLLEPKVRGNSCIAIPDARSLLEPTRGDTCIDIQEQLQNITPLFFISLLTHASILASPPNPNPNPNCKPTLL